MDTTDFMQKLSQHAQQTGELMEEAVRQMEMLQAELEQAKAERDAAIKDIPHKCWSCGNGFYTENGFDCNETHYKSGHKDCLSWQWRGAKEG